MAEPNRIDKQTMVMDIRQLVPLDEAKSYWLCLNENTWLLVQMLHSFYGSWRNRYSQNVDVVTPIQPDDEQWNLVMDIFDRGEMELTQVTCLDDLVNAIEGITAQISLSQSSGGCGCVASGDTDIRDIDDTLPQDVPTGEEFPPGFEDRSEFDTYRCKAATKIFDDYIGTLRNWAGLSGTVGGLTIAVIVGLSLLLVPPAGLIIILAALGTLLGINANLFANLLLIADAMDDNREETICDIYDAGTTAEAATALADAAGSEVEALDLGVLEATYLAITSNLISNQAMEVLTTKSAEVDDLPEADCGECGPAGDFLIELFDPLEIGDGGDLVQAGNHYTVTSASNGGRQAVNFHAVNPENVAEPRCFIITNIEITGASHEFYNDNGYICGAEEFEEFATGSMIDAEGLCFHGFILQSDPASPFTVEFDAVEGCE